MFNVPGIVALVIGVLVAIHVLIFFGGQQWEAWTLYAFAFIPSRFTEPGFPVLQGSQYWSFITYAFLHGDWVHLLFNSIWFLVFGTPAARYLGTPRFLLLCLIATLGAVAASLALHWGETVFLIGASGAVSGLLAAAMPLMYGVRVPGGARPATFPELMTNSKALVFMAVFLFMTLITGASGWTDNSFLGGAAIAWEAHMGGFVSGLAAFYLLAPKRFP